VQPALAMDQENVDDPTEQWETGSPTPAAKELRKTRFTNARTQNNSNYPPIKRLTLERKSPVVRHPDLCHETLSLFLHDRIALVGRSCLTRLSFLLITLARIVISCASFFSRVPSSVCRPASTSTLPTSRRTRRHTPDSSSRLWFFEGIK
jgi:hypothetical protein